MNKKIILISIIFAFLITLIPLRVDWSFDKSLKDGLVSTKLSSITYRLNYCSAGWYSYNCSCSGNYRQRKYCTSYGGCGSCYRYKNCGSTTYGSWSYYCSGSNLRRKRTIYYRGCSGNSCYYYTGTGSEHVRSCGSTTYGSWSYYCSGSNLRRKRTIYYRGCSGSSCYYYTGTGSEHVRSCGSRTSTTTYYCSGNTLKKKVVYSGGCSGTSCRSDSTYYYTVKDCGSRTCTSRTYYCSGDRLWYKYTCSGGCSGTSCRATINYAYLSKDCGSRTSTTTYYCSGNTLKKKVVYSGGCSGTSCRSDSTYYYTVKDCGSDEYGSWGSNYCKYGDVYHKRIIVYRGCSGTDCYENTEGDEQRVEYCSLGCKEGMCITGLCISHGDCGRCYYCQRWPLCTGVSGGVPWIGPCCRPTEGVNQNVCGQNPREKGSYCSQQEGYYQGCVGVYNACHGGVTCGYGNVCNVLEHISGCGKINCTSDNYCVGNKIYAKTTCSGGCSGGDCLEDRTYEYYLTDCGPRTYIDSYYCSGNKVYKKRVYSGGCSGGECTEDSIYTYYQEDCGTSDYKYRISGGWQQRAWCSRGCSNGSCYENCGSWSNYLQDCGHTCLSHGTASVGWPDCSCSRRSPASGYEIIGRWNTYDCGNNCTGYRKTGCSCTSWADRSCGGGSCSAYQRQQTRTCTPSGCDKESRCVSDSACGCSCTGWVNRSCGGGSCSATQRQQTRTCTPSGCDSESQCVADSACVSSPILNLTADPSSITQGQFSTLQWSSINTTSCTWTAGLSGGAATSGNRAVNPSTTTTYSMSCTGLGGNASGSAIVNVSPLINQSPSATNLKVVQPDYCLSGPTGFFSWTFTDPDPGDTQSAYRVQVDNNSNFSSPEDDSGKVTSSSNSYATILGKLKYNNTYYWRLKVWDSKGLDSIWISGPSFTTPTHAYPEIDFSWSPFKPSVDEEVLFVDQSTVYGGTTKESWSWTFQDGSPDSSAEQNPIAKFSSTGEKDITLRVTDSDGFSCSRAKTLNSQLPLPIWKEIAPF